MTPCRDYIIQAESGGSPRSRLFYQGEHVATVHGTVLEAQFAFKGGYLVFTRNGLVKGETLHIALLDTQRRPMDFVALSDPDEQGRLTDLHAAAPDAMTFSFFGSDDLWRLTVMNIPARMALEEDGPVRYPGSVAAARHRLRLERFNSTAAA
jgi:hypothetical protein